MNRWDIVLNGINHVIVFEGFKLFSRAKISIDGEQGVYSPVLVKKIGMCFPLIIDGSEITLMLDLHNNPIGLIQDGYFIETGLPIDEQIISALRESKGEPNPSAKKTKVVMGSFLTFVVLTYINLFLILINASISFPFSAMVPQLIIGIALSFYNETLSMVPIVVGTIISLVFASVYLVLYFLGKKRIWPIIVTLILVIIDSGVVLYLSMDDFASYLVDIAFHAWVIWSLISLIRIRRKKGPESTSNT